MGVIAWSKAYPARMKARSDAKMDPQGPEAFKDKKAREKLCAVNTPIVEDGFQKLNKSVQLRPDYDDAMAYLNLLFREKADCEESAADRKADLDQAEEWVDKLMKVKAVKAAKAAAAPAGAITK